MVAKYTIFDFMIQLFSDQVCDVVGGLKVTACKSDYTFETCTKNLCNDGKDNSGNSLKPILFLTALSVFVAMISQF